MAQQVGSDIVVKGRADFAPLFNSINQLKREAASVERQMRGNSSKKSFLDDMRKGTAEVSKGLHLVRRNAMAVVAGIGAAHFIPQMFNAAHQAIIGFNQQLDQAKIAFTSFTGSAQNANKIIGQLKDFATKTPFQFQDLLSASQKMLALGTSMDQLIPRLRIIGDTAAAMGGSAYVIERIQRALGQILAKGRVQSEELLQLAEVGIPAYRYVAEIIGTDIPTAMDKMKKGAISAEVAIEGLLQGMKRDYGGMMEAQAKTMMGAWSNVIDIITQRTAEITRPLFEALRDGILQFSKFLQGERFSNFADEVSKRLKAGIEGFVDGVEAVVNKLKPAFNQVVETAQAALDTFREWYPALKEVGKLLFTIWGVNMAAQIYIIANAAELFMKALNNPAAVAAMAAVVGMFTAGKLISALETAALKVMYLFDSIKTGAATTAATVGSLKAVIGGLVAAGIGLLISKWIAAKREAQAYRDEIVAIGKEIDSLGSSQAWTNFASNFRDNNQKLIGDLKKLGISIEDAYRYLAGVPGTKAGAFIEFRKQLAKVYSNLSYAGERGIKAAEAFKVLKERFTEFGFSAETTAASFLFSTASLKDLVAVGEKWNESQKEAQAIAEARIAAERTAGERTAERIEADRRAFNMLKGIDDTTSSIVSGTEDAASAAKRYTDNLGDGVSEKNIEDAWKDVEEAIKNVITAAEAYNDLITGQQDLNQRINRAFSSYYEGLSGFQESLKEAFKATPIEKFQEAIQNAKSPLDLLKNNSVRPLYEELDKMAGFILDITSAMKEQKRPNEEIQGAYEAMTGELRHIMTEAGLAIEDIDKLLGMFGLLPGDVTTTLNLADEQYKAGIQATLDTLKNPNTGIPENITTYLQTLLDKGKVEEVAAAVEGLKDETSRQAIILGIGAEIYPLSKVPMLVEQGELKAAVAKWTEAEIQIAMTWSGNPPLEIWNDSVRPKASPAKTNVSVDALSGSGMTYGANGTLMPVVEKARQDAEIAAKAGAGLSLLGNKLKPVFTGLLATINVIANITAFTGLKSVPIIGRVTQQIDSASGNILSFASGAENHVAQIAPAGAMRLWAEPETGGEAYIPLAQSKRERSTNILAAVATKFGFKLMSYANGGGFDTGVRDRMTELADKFVRALDQMNKQFEKFNRIASTFGSLWDSVVKGVTGSMTAIMKWDQALEDAGSGILSMSKTADFWNPRSKLGRQVYQTMTGLRDDLMTMVEDMLASGESEEDITKAYKDEVTRLRQMLQSSGWGTTEIEDYFKRIGLSEDVGGMIGKAKNVEMQDFLKNLQLPTLMNDDLMKRLQELVNLNDREGLEKMSEAYTKIADQLGRTDMDSRETGKDIQYLQQVLARTGVNIEATGEMDSPTRKALENLQKRWGLEGTGQLDKQTWALVDNIAKAKGMEVQKPWNEVLMERFIQQLSESLGIPAELLKSVVDSMKRTQDDIEKGNEWEKDWKLKTPTYESGPKPKATEPREPIRGGPRTISNLGNDARIGFLNEISVFGEGIKALSKFAHVEEDLRMGFLNEISVISEGIKVDHGSGGGNKVINIQIEAPPSMNAKELIRLLKEYADDGNPVPWS